MWAPIGLLRLIQRPPRNPFFTNNPQHLTYSTCSERFSSRWLKVLSNNSCNEFPIVSAQCLGLGIYKTQDFHVSQAAVPAIDIAQVRTLENT